MKKLIEIDNQGTDLVVCDNPNCGFHIPWAEENKNDLVNYVNVPCPQCGENLCTENDFLQYEKLMNTVNWVNKYFSWWTYLFFWEKEKTVNVHVHEGINIVK